MRNDRRGPTQVLLSTVGGAFAAWFAVMGDSGRERAGKAWNGTRPVLATLIAAALATTMVGDSRLGIEPVAKETVRVDGTALPSPQDASKDTNAQRAPPTRVETPKERGRPAAPARRAAAPRAPARRTRAKPARPAGVKPAPQPVVRGGEVLLVDHCTGRAVLVTPEATYLVQLVPDRQACAAPSGADQPSRPADREQVGGTDDGPCLTVPTRPMPCHLPQRESGRSDGDTATDRRGDARDQVATPRERGTSHDSTAAPRRTATAAPPDTRPAGRDRATTRPASPDKAETRAPVRGQGRQAYDPRPAPEPPAPDREQAAESHQPAGVPAEEREPAAAPQAPAERHTAASSAPQPVTEARQPASRHDEQARIPDVQRVAAQARPEAPAEAPRAPRGIHEVPRTIEDLRSIEPYRPAPSQPQASPQQPAAPARQAGAVPPAAPVAPTQQPAGSGKPLNQMSDTELAQRLKDLVEARQQGRKIDPDFAEEFAIRDLLTQHGLRPEIGVDPRSQFRGFEVEGPLRKVPFVGRYLSKVVPKRYLDYLNGWTRLAANPHTGEIQVGGGLSVGPQGIPGRVGALTRMPDGLTAYVRGELDFETASKVFGSLGKLGPAGQAGGGGFVEFYGEGKVDAHGVVHGFAQLHVKLPVTAGKVTPRVARNWSFTWDLRTNEFKVHGSGGWVQLNVGGHGVRTDGTNHQLMYMGPQLKEGKAKPWEKGVPGATTKSAELQAGVRGRYTFQNRPLAQGLTRLFDVFGWIGMSSALAAERLDRGWEDLLDWVDRSPVPTGRDLPESWQRALGVRPAGAPPDWGKVDLSEYDEEDGDQERPAGPDQAGSGEGSGSDGGGNNAGDGNPSDGPVQSESGRAASSQAGPDGGPDPNYDGDPGSPDPGPVDPGGYESPGDPHNDNEAENQGDNQSGSQVGNPSDNGSNQSSNPSSPDPGGHESPGDPHNDNEAENQGDDQSGSQAGNPSNDGPVQSESGRAASSQAGPDGGPDPNYDGGSTTTDPGGGEPAGGGDTDADTGSCNCV